MSLVFVDGRQVREDRSFYCDVVIVGSGPAGATVARSLARSGVDVVVVEEGRWVRSEQFPPDGLGALAALYRGAGLTVTRGRAPAPVLQGRVLGGSSVVNSAICWRLPREVHDAWTSDDPALADALVWDDLEAASAAIEGHLGVAPTEADVSGANGLLLAEGASAVGLEHRPIRRNVSGCTGLGRCNQGCPTGAKLSMDRTYLPEAAGLGARLFTSVTVEEILRDRNGACGVRGVTPVGGNIRILARRAVVLAASAIHTPALLISNGIGHGPVGRRLQCHPGLTVVGRFPDAVRAWTGASQGHEVLGLRARGIKIESLGFDRSLLASRLAGIGTQLAAGVDDLAHWASWGAAIRSTAIGTVRPGRGRPRVRFDPTAEDLTRTRVAIAAIARLMFAAGASEVVPGVHGWPAQVCEPDALDHFEDNGPRDARSFGFAISHLFGTCRMGSDAGSSVVRPDFRHHAVDRLYVADSSVFPTNTGVNPQISIMAMASLCARAIAA